MIGKCWGCDCETEHIHNHHVVPRSRGGTRTVPLCEPCHSKAHHRKKNMNTSTLVKEAYLRRKKEVGSKPWGNPNIHKNCSPLGQAVMKANALKFNTRIQGICDELKTLGYCTLQQLSDKLSELGIKTRRGSEFRPSSLHHVLNYREGKEV